MNIPGRELIEKLEVLRLRIINSGVERTSALLRGMGDDCSYYRKSLDIFLRKDYDELKKLLSEVLERMEKLDGERR